MCQSFYKQSKEAKYQRIHLVVGYYNNNLPEDLQRPPCVMPGAAGERELQGQLAPSLGEAGVGQGELEDVEDVREEDVDLVGRADAPHGARDVLVLPEGLTFPAKTYDWDQENCSREGFVDARRNTVASFFIKHIVSLLIAGCFLHLAFCNVRSVKT